MGYDELIAQLRARYPGGRPVPLDEFTAVERLLGIVLPELLRRVYTEVADGGFYSREGELFNIMPDEGSDPIPPTWYRETLTHAPELARLGWPLYDHGCAIWSYVSLTEDGHPVRVWDPVEGTVEEGLAVLRTQRGIPLDDWFRSRFDR